MFRKSLTKLRSKLLTPATKQKNLHSTLGVTVWKFRASHPARVIRATTSFARLVSLLAYKSQMAIFLLPILYPPFKSDALPKIVVKFVQRDVRNRFYANRRKLVKKKACNLPDLGLDLNNNVYISESLTSTCKKLFGEINKERKRLKWKHIWTQNGRIFVKEADAGRSFSFNSFEDLAKFRSSLRQ